MDQQNLYGIIRIDEYSVTPKYQQVINALLKGIADGKLEKGMMLPSINDLSFELDISRDTGIRAYRDLKNMGIIHSVPGKGYFIATTGIQQRIKVFLLFNKLSTHKKIIYDAFVAALGDKAAIDFYIYNNDFSLFRELLKNRKEDYAWFVIIPHFMDGGESAHEVINTIPKEKLILMDKRLPLVTGHYGAVYEQFEKDLYHALQEALDLLKKYHTLKIIFPEYTYHPREILTGFSRFCIEYAFNYATVSDLSRESISEGTAYISLMENDLVTLIEKVLDAKWVIGKQVGVISYNETPLKRIILNGITTISTDFHMMGEIAAQLILDKSTEHIPIPFHLRIRESL